MSRRDRRCTQPTAAAALDGRLPLIFLNVPQAELLSLISAAKSLGFRGLAEETSLDVVSDDSDRISDRIV